VRPTPVKKCTLMVSSVALWLTLLVLSGSPLTWLRRLQDETLGLPALLSASLWACVLLWAMHHLAFQVGGLLGTNSRSPGPANEDKPAVAILYTTCDDFNAACCKSCLEQDYENFSVLVLDDSKSQTYKSMVENFCTTYTPRCIRITRPSHVGFKAGNLNHAVESFVKEDWVLLIDADQTLPRDYLSTLVSELPNDEHIAFLQTASRGSADQGSSSFQRSLILSVPLYFFRDLTLREGFGFLPLLGHSALIRRSAWERTGRFPLVVSEDYAFAMRLATLRRRGAFVRTPVGSEGIPYDFGGFMVRLRKYAAGTAELFRREMIPFLLGPAHLAEKWDALMQLGWYILTPLVTLNGFLSAYVLHRMWNQGQHYLHPVLPLLYSLTLFAFLCLYLSVSHGIGRAIRFYFWSTAINAAAMPLAGLSFLRHIVHCNPAFKRTPKNKDRESLRVSDCLFMLALGLLAVVCARSWPSPFSLILLSQGISYLSYPLYGELSSGSLLGSLGRALIYIPGLLVLAGLCVLWRNVAPAQL
jgi:cellulose synthase/poly-beta-1,6-N-acetylglucosamine synthase-like glycosyltransferase